MKIKKVTAAFFSPTGNVQKVSECIGRAAAEMLQAEYMEFDFLRPENRYDIIRFGPDELLVVGVPVYAGRVPNKILPFIQSGFRSAAGTFCIPFVCFGNRSFDDGLSELTMEMRNSGFAVVGAAAVASEHSFCESLASGRPDEQDMRAVRGFTERICEKILLTGKTDRCTAADNGGSKLILDENDIPGNTPPGPYYTPRRTDGEPAVFLKAKPKTDKEKCHKCMECADRCPMGSISSDDPAQISGICIKCQACIKCCPNQAKFFDDPNFLSHREALALSFGRRAESVFVL